MSCSRLIRRRASLALIPLLTRGCRGRGRVDGSLRGAFWDVGVWVTLCLDTGNVHFGSTMSVGCLE